MEDGRLWTWRTNFPEECRYVLETLGGVYHHDALAREQELSPEERLRFHQEHSGPLMEGLHEWMETQLAEHKTEPNSGLGKAISYLLRHWPKLTLFLRQAGAPVDNNLVTAARGSDKGYADFPDYAASAGFPNLPACFLMVADAA